MVNRPIGVTFARVVFFVFFRSPSNNNNSDAYASAGRSTLTHNSKDRSNGVIVTRRELVIVDGIFM